MFSKIIFDYEIKEKIGENTFTEVFLGSKPGLDKKLSLVMLKPHWYDEEHVRIDFLAHANILAQLRHPRIIEVFDIGEKDGRLFMVTEHMPHGSLRQLLEKPNIRLTRTQVAGLIEEVAAALDYMHTYTSESLQSAVYGNLTPENILLGQDLKDPNKLHAKLSNNGRWLKPEDLNDTGIILPANNPEYISPEEAADHPLTPFSDQYSLGILAYELLAGQTPFHGESAVTIYRKHKNQAPAPPSTFNGDLTVAIDEAVLRALQKSPSSRYENCSQFARALRAAVEVMAEKEFNLFLEQARIAMEIRDVEAGISALDGAIRIKPNSIEVKSLAHSLKNLERATNFYKEACDSFAKAQQMARSIREEEPDYPDKDHLLTKLVPPPVSFLKIIRKNSRVALMTFFISIGFAVVAGMATIIYSETAGSQTFRSTIVAIDRTSTPTFAPATPYTLTPAVTPQQ